MGNEVQKFRAKGFLGFFIENYPEGIFVRIGILALAIIFFASGGKNLQDYRGLAKTAKTNEETGAARRRLLFGVLMLLLGVMVTVYYFVTL